MAQTLDIRVLFQQMQTNVFTVRVNKNIVAPLKGQNFLYVDNISRRLVTSPEISLPADNEGNNMNQRVMVGTAPFEKYSPNLFHILFILWCCAFVWRSNVKNKTNKAKSCDR